MNAVFVLKEAGKRARRFKNFVKRTIDDITPGDIQELYKRVIKIFDDLA
jgi:hypothetical protein